MGSFDAKLLSCDQSFPDFIGWDFEDQTMTNWEIINENDNYKWDIIEAIDSKYKESRVYDHTTMTKYGYLAETTNKGNAINGSKTIFRSIKVDQLKASFYCLSFWFWKISGNDLLEIGQVIYHYNQTVCILR